MTNLEMMQKALADSVATEEDAAVVLTDPSVLVRIVDRLSRGMCVPEERPWCYESPEKDVHEALRRCVICMTWWLQQESAAGSEAGK